MRTQLTPWRKLRKNAFTYTIVDKEGNYIFEVPTSKDVHNTIIKAVNNHDRLVEALEQVIEDINTGNYEFGEHMFDEWNQLLTELKS